ncbi:MAG TPA: class I SAM-dependent methyltransferase [Gammaproteobacteria bacterium]|nr:class I SAM-dependent methyltransferase [Gammaproteobacteria bacterium]
MLRLLAGFTVKPRRVLDLGAGNGALCHELAAAGYEVVGVEPDAAGMEIASRRNAGARFYQLAVDDPPDAVLADSPDGFDAVVSTEVIEHLYAPRQLAAFTHAVLHDQGHLVLTTPYHGYLKNLAIAVTNGWDHHADPLWDGGHIKLFSRRTIARLLTEAGFRIVHFGGVGRLPYLWKSMTVVAAKQ